MITSTLTSKAQTTIPRAIRRALDLHAGDAISYEIEGERVVLRRARPERLPEDPFATFDEWDSEIDRRAYAGL